VWKLGLKHSIHDHCDVCDLRAIALQDVWMGWYGGMVQCFWSMDAESWVFLLVTVDEGYCLNHRILVLSKLHF
jgi:hypothetical protein